MTAVLLALIFIRPFISSLAFPCLNLAYSAILLGFLSGWIITKSLPLKKIGGLKYPIILFLLALIISIILSANKINSLNELYKYITGILIFLFALSLDYGERTRIIKTITLAAFIISILAIYQYFFGFRRLLDYLTKNTAASSFALDYINRSRVFFPFVTPNILAGYLAMVMPLALLHKNRVWIIIPLSFGILLAKSLGALLSILAGLAIYFIIRDCPRRGLSLNPYLQGNLNKKRVLLIAGLLSIIGVIFLMRQAATKEHTLPAFSLITRLNYWRDTLGIINNNFWTGVGLGNFNLPESRYAHNSYLQIWAEMGILGIVSIIWLIAAVLKSAFKNIKGSPYKSQTACLITACIAFLIHNFVDFSFFLPEVSFIWWLILGLIWQVSIPILNN